MDTKILDGIFYVEGSDRMYVKVKMKLWEMRVIVAYSAICSYVCSITRRDINYIYTYSR